MSNESPDSVDQPIGSRFRRIIDPDGNAQVRVLANH